MSLSPARFIARGRWEVFEGVTMTATAEEPQPTQSSWRLGQLVEVAPRTWSGINRLGGHGKVTKIHYKESGAVKALDVQYTINGGHDTNLDPDLVKPYEELTRRSRSRRSAAPSNPERIIEKENDHGKSKKRSQSTARRRGASSKPKKKQDENIVCDKEYKLPKNIQTNVKRKVATKSSLYPPETCTKGTIPSEILVPLPRHKKNNKKVSDIVSPLGCVDTISISRKRSNPDICDIFDVPLNEMSPGSDGCGEGGAVPSETPNTGTRTKRLATGRFSDGEATSQQQILSPQPPETKVHLTLGGVYNGRREEAKKFIDAAVVARQETTDHEKSATEAEKDTEKNERQRAFYEVLNELFIMQSNELDQSCLVESVNEMSDNCFSQEEATEFVKRLDDQGKVQISDGMIYLV